MSAEFIVGTRGSALALAQTERVLRILQAASPTVRFHVTTVRTTGDRHPNQALDRLPGVGVFVKELEEALLSGAIDLAVHSMKDLPPEPTPGVAVAAVTAREDPRDVLVAAHGYTLAALPAGARIGTSSPRRAGFLRAARPDIAVVPVRGNVETRMRKVDAGDVEAVCLAAAGLLRLGQGGRVTDWLPADLMMPAPGQGALGIQVRDGDQAAAEIAAAAGDPAARTAVSAERAMLKQLEGGCRLAAGALAQVVGDRLEMTAAVVSLDGRRIIRAQGSGAGAEAVAIGMALADALLAQGAGRLEIEQARTS
jgi:hydroxymethylbilane synthase